jgi:hypothetical protein
VNNDILSENKKIIRIGFSPTVWTTTTSSHTGINVTTMYNIQLQQVEDRVVAKCLDIQGAVTDGKDENEAMDNIIEAIKAINAETQLSVK